MKKLYSMLLSAVVALAGTATAAAEECQVTFTIDDPSALTITAGSEDAVVPELVSGDNVITYNPDKYPAVYLRTVEGYAFKKIAVVEGQASDLWIENGGTQSAVYLQQYHNGSRWEVSTYNLEETRTAQLTINVTDNANLILANRGGRPFTLENGENIVKFNPEEEKQFSFRRNDYGKMNYVKQNGANVSDYYGTYSVEVSDGDQLEIAPTFPDVDVPVKFVIPEGCESIFERVTVNYDEVTNYLSDDFTVKAGKDLTFYLNQTDYQINGITVNDEPMSYPGYYNTVSVGTDPLLIVIDAESYGTLNFTVNVNDATGLSIYPGGNAYSTPFDIVTGENHLSIGSRTGQIYVKADATHIIESITDAEGNDIHHSDYVIYITDGMVININMAEKVFDSKMVVYCDNTDETYTAFWRSEVDSENTYFKNGYNVIPFASAQADAVRYNIVISCMNTYIAYVDGELVSNEYGQNYYNWMGNPVDGKVIKVFTTGTEPTLHNVTFEVSGDRADDVKVTSDLVRTEENWRDGVALHAGSQLTIECPEDVTLGVTVDGNDHEADETGNHNLTVAADHVITISATSGVANVAADAALKSGAVYNLQGVRVLDSADDAALETLPAGIYVSNGRKIVVR